MGICSTKTEVEDSKVESKKMSKKKMKEEKDPNKLDVPSENDEDLSPVSPCGLDNSFNEPEKGYESSDSEDEDKEDMKRLRLINREKKVSVDKRSEHAFLQRAERDEKKKPKGEEDGVSEHDFLKREEKEREEQRKREDREIKIKARVEGEGEVKMSEHQFIGENT